MKLKDEKDSKRQNDIKKCDDFLRKCACVFPHISLPRAVLLLVLLLILYFASVVGLSFHSTEQHYTSWESDSESKTKVVPEKL